MYSWSQELDEMFIRTMKEGKFQMIGDGSVMMNPISNTDLAERICECLISEQDWNTSISVGGRLRSQALEGRGRGG